LATSELEIAPEAQWPSRRSCWPDALETHLPALQAGRVQRSHSWFQSLKLLFDDGPQVIGLLPPVPPTGRHALAPWLGCYPEALERRFADLNHGEPGPLQKALKQLPVSLSLR